VGGGGGVRGWRPVICAKVWFETLGLLWSLIFDGREEVEGLGLRVKVILRGEIDSAVSGATKCCRSGAGGLDRSRRLEID